MCDEDEGRPDHGLTHRGAQEPGQTGQFGQLEDRLQLNGGSDYPVLMIVARY